MIRDALSISCKSEAEGTRFPRKFPLPVFPPTGSLFSEVHLGFIFVASIYKLFLDPEGLTAHCITFTWGASKTDNRVIPFGMSCFMDFIPSNRNLYVFKRSMEVGIIYYSFFCVNTFGDENAKLCIGREETQNGQHRGFMFRIYK